MCEDLRKIEKEMKNWLEDYIIYDKQRVLPTLEPMGCLGDNVDIITYPSIFEFNIHKLNLGIIMPHWETWCKSQIYKIKINRVETYQDIDIRSIFRWRVLPTIKKFGDFYSVKSRIYLWIEEKKEEEKKETVTPTWQSEELVYDMIKYVEHKVSMVLTEYPTSKNSQGYEYVTFARRLKSIDEQDILENWKNWIDKRIAELKYHYPKNTPILFWRLKPKFALYEKDVYNMRTRLLISIDERNNANT